MGQIHFAPLNFKKKHVSSDVPAALEGWPVVKPHPELVRQKGQWYRIVGQIRVANTPFFVENVWVQNSKKRILSMSEHKIMIHHICKHAVCVGSLPSATYICLILSYRALPLNLCILMVLVAGCWDVGSLSLSLSVIEGQSSLRPPFHQAFHHH